MIGASSGQVKSWLLTRVTTHMGSSQAEFAPALVASWGRLQGRHRLRFQSAVQERKYALGDLDPPSARKTVEDFFGECEGCVVDDSSKEISLTTLRNTSWTVRAMCRLVHHEAIHLLETRDLISGATRCEKWYCKRCVTLLDKMV